MFGLKYSGNHKTANRDLMILPNLRMDIWKFDELWRWEGWGQGQGLGQKHYTAARVIGGFMGMLPLFDARCR